MPMKPSDAILSAPRGTAAQAIAYARANDAERMADVEALIRELYRPLSWFAFDPSILVSQSAHETDIWRSPAWVSRLNPAGLGITDGTDFGYVWQNGTDAAKAQIAHMGAYVGVTVPQAYRDLDPRYGAVAAAGYAGDVDTIKDLTGRWATDKAYHTKICRHGNAIWPNLPDQGGTMPDIVFGRVPPPPMQVRDIINSTAWNDLGPRVIRGVVWHRMLGTLMGTDGYFRGEARTRALTDYGVGVGQDGANDGVVFRWNDPRGRRSPWANGPVSAPYGDGKAFIDRYGVTASQRDLASVEISGMQTTPLTAKSRQAIAHITAYWADQYRVPWDEFPAVPDEGRSFVLWHEELTAGTGKECPFEVVKDETPSLIEQTKGILKRHQTEGGPVPEPPTPPSPGTNYPDHVDEGVAERMFGSVRGEDGRTYAYDERGPISALWLSEGSRSKRFPPIEAVWSYEEGKRRYFRFVGGMTFFVGEDGTPVVIT